MKSKSTFSKKTEFSEDLTIKIRDGLISTLMRESSAILYLVDNFPDTAIKIVEKILECKGHVVFCGLGKSGLIGRKIAATFSSMAIPSVFLHPSEALHGDLGSVRPDDLIIFLSKSASGEEYSQIIPLLRSQGNFLILIYCTEGNLANKVDLLIKLPFKREACELNLAPTSSSTLMLAFGDALAIVASSLRGFSKNDFARFHPGGKLGKNLLLKVCDFINDYDVLPLVYPSTPFYEVLLTMTSGKRGVGIVVDYQGRPLGVITDGDLRRACESGAVVFEKKAAEIMSTDPKVVAPDIRALTALEIMEDHNITSLIVVENEKIMGLVHIHDIIKSGISRV